MASPSDEKYSTIPQDTIGLDRSHINPAGQIELPTQHPTSPGETDARLGELHDDADQDPNIKLSKRRRFSLKTKGILHIGSESKNKIGATATAPILAEAQDTARTSKRLISEQPEPENSTLKDLLQHPVKTVIAKVTGSGGHQVAANLVAKEISHGKEVDLVEAQDAVVQAKTATDQLLAMHNVDDLLKARQDMFVRWTMDRHVSKVRRLQYNTMPYKDRKSFVVITPDQRTKTDWSAYLKHLAKHYTEKYGGEYIGENGEPPAITKEAVVPSVERLLVASAPFQTLIMTVRKIYRWENRYETLKYLFGYSVLWMLNMVLPGILLGTIYLIAHRKIHPPTVDDLRKEIMRTENVNEIALTLAEFIEKKGDENWVGPMIDTVGPWAMVQLADAANFMEILRNFYEWREPLHTGTTLSLLVVSFVAVTVTPVWLLARATTLFMGIAFFFLFPISSRYPEYRLLVSPVKWIFWKIPTHAEWSVKSLQAEGNRVLKAVNASNDFNKKPQPLAPESIPNLDSKGYHSTPATTKHNDPRLNSESTSSARPSKLLGSYRSGHHGKPAGALILTSTGVRFETAIGNSANWSLEYTEIKRLEKVTRMRKRNLTQTTGEDLKFVGSDEVEHVVLNLERRDEAFSQVVGFSPVTWQIVW